MIAVSGGANATISRSIVKNSFTHGIVVSGSTSILTVSNSTIYNNTDAGIGITSLGQANIQGSTFTGN